MAAAPTGCAAQLQPECERPIDVRSDAGPHGSATRRATGPRWHGWMRYSWHTRTSSLARRLETRSKR